MRLSSLRYNRETRVFLKTTSEVLQKADEILLVPAQRRSRTSDFMGGLLVSTAQLGATILYSQKEARRFSGIVLFVLYPCLAALFFGKFSGFASLSLLNFVVPVLVLSFFQFQFLRAGCSVKAIKVLLVAVERAKRNYEQSLDFSIPDRGSLCRFH